MSSLKKEEIKKIFSFRKGCIIETDSEIRIENKNLIRSYYVNGEVAVEKVVFCVVGVNLDRDRLFADEKTCEIIGGACGLEPTEENLNRYLDKYNFEKQVEPCVTQLSFLSLI